MKLKKCIGIISGFPHNDIDKQRRLMHFENLLAFFEKYWPDVDVLIIAQNWQDYKMPKIKNKVIVKYFDDLLGITQARQILREEYLKLDYDYIILLDDDADIHIDNEQLPADYMNEIDKHPGGYCFIHSDNHWRHHDDVARSPLNLCAISTELFAKEEIPDVHLEDYEAMEDDVYATLFLVKYPDKEFMPPVGIYHTHSFKYMYVLQYTKREISPAVWYCAGVSTFPRLWHNTNFAIDYIREHGDFNLEDIKKDARWVKPGDRSIYNGSI